jgi:FAD/FMN-containing dehydrogenase
MNRRRFLQASISAALAGSLPARAAFVDALYHPTQIPSDIDAVTGDGAQVTLAKAAVQELSDSLKGSLLLPGSPGYDDARQLLDPTFDKHPALVVQPSGAADVSSAVQFARDNSLLLAVKCGGHSNSGKSSCDGGMEIDLSTLRDVYVDPLAMTARVDGGSLLSELDHEAMAFGLVTTAGTVSHTGVGGLTLGGGFGRLARRFGLAIDNVLAFDVVTADGKLRRASADRNPDLYWALRGGGGNFGVVTSFLFRLHPMQRDVIHGEFVFPLSEAKQVLRFLGEYADGAPDALHVGMFLGAGPGMPGPIVGIDTVWCGDANKAEQIVAPIRKAGKLLQDKNEPVDYVALQRSGDVKDPRANAGYIESGFIGKITPELVDDIVDNFEIRPDRSTWIATQQSGGAIGRVAEDATAFAHRESQHNLLSFVQWDFGTDPTEHIKYIKANWQHLESYTHGFYVNDALDESQAELNANYRGNYARLSKIKREYDPTNLFRLNANILPA